MPSGELAAGRPARRSVTTEVVCYAPLFNSLQLQPTVALSLAFEGSHLWLVEHLGVSLRRLVYDYRLGLVVHGAQLEYREPVGYRDVDTLRTTTSVQVKKDGLRLEVQSSITAEGRSVAEVTITGVPVAIADGRTLAAVPSRITPAVLAKFLPEEIDEDGDDPVVARAAAEVEAKGDLLGQRDHAFALHRHHCEFADQWYFAEVAGFINGGSEALAFDSREPALRRRLTHPLRRVDILYSRAAFHLDRLRVVTRAFRHAGGLRFLHRIAPENERGGTYALAIETAAEEAS